jgi:hypothetical protein
MRRKSIYVKVLWVLLIAFCIMPPLSYANMGYDIVATVDSTTWEIHRSIQSLTFSSEGYVLGHGNSSRFNRIRGFGGIESDEQSHTKKGQLGYGERQILMTREGPVTITINAMETTFPEVDEEAITDTEKFKVENSANIIIDENWLSYFANYKKVAYVGEGINSREKYENNGDVVATDIESWVLSKESMFQASLNRTYIKTDITPGNIDEKIYQNKSSTYNLKLNSTGPLAHLGVINQQKYENYGRATHDTGISEDYMGQIEMALNISMGQHFSNLDSESIGSWLDCCFDGNIYRDSNQWEPPYGLEEWVFGTETLKHQG